MYKSTTLNVVSFFLIGTIASYATSPIEKAGRYNFSAVANNNTIEMVAIDPIVTGVGVSDEQMLRWEASNKLYQACDGLCDEGQPFPND